MAQDEKETDKDKEIKLQRFGRYLLLDHLVDGGMAKICRARHLGEQGTKIVAIKMIQSQYSLDPSFKQMFLDEIKVTFGLSHPNIAQTYDYGFISGQLYTAIEYVDGKNLKQFLDRLKDRKFVFPVEISTFIISQICQGLTYAHNFTDKLTGKVLNIIHRDISPHNIMITYDGAVKIIDFGIAKAETNSEETKAGTIKGKLSYLAPEYLDGMDLDHRYDQFAVGITLWELLCSRKLFQANNELATLKKIQSCSVPEPSTINPNVPKELDQIVLKSLSKDRNLRFQNMDQFNRALVKFLYSHYPDFNATDLNYFAKELFKDDIKADKEKLFKFGQIDITPFLLDLKHETEGGTSPGSSGAVAAATARAEKEAQKDDSSKGVQKATVLEFGLDDDKVEGGGKGLSLDLDKSKIKTNVPASMKSQRATTPPPKQTMNKTGINKADASNPNNRIAIPKPVIHKTSESISRPSVRSEDDSKKAGQGGGTSKELKVEETEGKSKMPYAVVAAGLLLVGMMYSFFKKGPQSEHAETASNGTAKGRDPSSEGTGNAKKEALTSRRIMFTNTNTFQQFFINNREVSIIGGVELALHTNQVLRVEQDKKIPIFVSFVVTEDSPGTIRLPDAKEGFFGILKSSPDYPEESYVIIPIEGTEVTFPLPLTELKLPVGKYQGSIKSGITGVTKDVSFVILENAITKLPK